MQRTPPKRRKLSPTTSIPIDAPTTPSRAPSRDDGAQTSARRPSYAAPTQASISKHNPQLLNRPSSSGSGTASKGRNLDDLFARALGEKTLLNEEDGLTVGDRDRRPRSQGSIAGSRDGSATLDRPITPNAGGFKSTGFLAKPRRLSRSPVKSPTKRQESITTAGIGGTDGKQAQENPFQKRSGLRRSPIYSQADPVGKSADPLQDDVVLDGSDPFQKKSRVARSPILSAPLPVEQDIIQNDNTPKAPPPARRVSPRLSKSPVDPQEKIGQIGNHPGISPFRKGALRRSPISAFPQPVTTVEEGNSHDDGPPATPQTPKIGPSRTPVLGPSQALFPPSNAIAQLGTHPGISPMRKGALRRSPVLAVAQPFLTVEQVEAEMQAQENVEVEADPPQSPFRDVTQPIESSPEAENELVGQSHSTSPKAPTPDIVQFQAQAIKAIDQTELRQDNRTATLMIPDDVSRSLVVSNPEETSIVEAEESHQASEILEISKSPSIQSAALRAANRQIDPIVALPFPKKALDYQSLSVASPKKSSPLRSRKQVREPDLPPTPSQLGIADPVMTTPPAGIHNTPSTRARRNKALSEKLKSSPLKPRDPDPDESSQERIPDSYPEPRTLFKTKSAEKKAPRRSTRFIIPPDPHASKKEARDRLLQELQQLQADVSLANRENERIRALHETGKRRIPEAPNSDDLLALLLRATEQPSEPKPKPASIFKSITSFLPFSSRHKTQDLGMLNLDKPLPSHLPVHVDDPLPYLRAFTPLTYTSTVTLLPAEQESPGSVTQEEQPIFQNYSIRASHPSGLFAARISMVVNSSTLSIKEVSVPSLELAAENELGSFVKERVAQDSMGKDISVICWAMGRWTEVAIERAKLWCDIQEELGTPEARRKSLERLMARRKRKRVVEEDDDQDGGEKTTRRPRTRRQLLLNMGRTNMQISNDDVEILFEWKIGFDWTGEAESFLSAHARLPTQWQREDDRSSLSKIPKTFQGLLKYKGTFAAARAIVGLLMTPGEP